MSSGTTSAKRWIWRAQGRAPGESRIPMVGAVLVRDGEVVGRGFHTCAGREACRDPRAGSRPARRARGATLYIKLEPCSHQGRTPPCADALIAAGVPRWSPPCRIRTRWCAATASRAARRRHRSGDRVGLHGRGREAQRSFRALHAHRPAAGHAQDRRHAGWQDRRAGRQSRLDHQRNARARTCSSCAMTPTRS